jgi:hypothetical protein
VGYNVAVIRSALAAAIAVAAALIAWWNTPAIRDRTSHAAELRAHEEALRPALAAIPPDAVVGYVADRPVAGIHDAARLFATQYFLAPRLVIPLDQPGRRPVDIVLAYGVNVDMTRLRNPRRLSSRLVLADP